MMGFGWFLGILFIGVFAYLFGWRPSGNHWMGYQKTSLEILKERYAKGEISKEEYDQMREDLLKN